MINGKPKYFTAATLKAIVAAVILSTSAAMAEADATEPFALLIGKWKGGGIMAMSDGTRERIVCDAEHSGTALQLRLIIHCVSGERDIRMQANMSSNAGRLLGFWEEKYFNAAGAITGVATGNKISFTVSGNVNGKMIVDYSKNRQKISITTKNVPLSSLKIDMKRR